MKKLCLLFIAGLMSLAALASGSNLAFRHYTTDNGLPSNCVRDIMQDSRGFIWFATDGGLVRFDGQRFRVFSLSKVEGKHFQDDFVSSMHELDGKIWIGVDTHSFFITILKLKRFLRLSCTMLPRAPAA